MGVDDTRRRTTGWFQPAILLVAAALFVLPVLGPADAAILNIQLATFLAWVATIVLTVAILVYNFTPLGGER
jgi:hypothetical protein